MPGSTITQYAEEIRMNVIDSRKKAKTKRMLTRSAQTVQYKLKIAIIRFQKARPLRNPGACHSLACKSPHCGMYTHHRSLCSGKLWVGCSWVGVSNECIERWGECRAKRQEVCAEDTEEHSREGVS